MGIEEGKKSAEQRPNQIDKPSEASSNEVVTSIPVFSYDEPGELERAKRIANIPRQYPDIAEAYLHLAEDPQFKSGVTPTYPTAMGASYDEKLKTMVRPTNPIAMAYLLDTIGVENFRTIVSRMDSENRKKVLQAVLKGETGAIFDHLLPEDGASRLSGLYTGDFTHGSREDQLAQGLASVAFENRSLAYKLNIIQLTLSSDAATLKDAYAIIRNRFEKEAKATP